MAQGQDKTLTEILGGGKPAAGPAPTKQEPSDETLSLGEMLSEGFGNFVRAVSGAAAAGSEVAGIIGTRLGIPGAELAYLPAVRARALGEIIAPDPLDRAYEEDWKSFLATDVASGLGSSIPAIPVGIVGGVLGGPGGAAAGMALSGVASEFSQTYWEARGAGKSEKEAFEAALMASPIGLLEGVGAEAALAKAGGKALVKKLASGLAKEEAKGGLVSTGLHMLAGAASESATEAAQTFLHNAVAQAKFDEDRELTEGLAQSAGAAALIGALFGVGTSSLLGVGRSVSKAAGEAQAGETSQEAAGSTQTEEAPEVEADGETPVGEGVELPGEPIGPPPPIKGFDVPDETAMDKFQAAAVNYFHRAEVMESAATGVPVGEGKLARAQQVMPGKIFDLQQEIKDRFETPMATAARNAGISLEESTPGKPSVGDFITALGAQERNATGFERDNNFDPENNPASGMSDTEAMEILEEAFYGPASKAYTEIQNINRKLGAWTLRLKVSEQLLDEETANQWVKEFGKDYAPHRTVFEPDASFTRRKARGVGVSGPESHRMKGRRTRADNPWIQHVMQAREAAVRAKRNEVGRVLFDLVGRTQNEMGDLWRIEVDEEHITDEEKREGRAISLKIAGKPAWVVVGDQSLARALSAIDVKQAPMRMELMQKMLATLRKLFTTWNPDFLVTNPFRDVQGASAKVGLRYGKKAGAKVVLNYVPAAKAAFRVFKDPSAKGYWEDAYRRARKAGAIVNWHNLGTFQETLDKAQLAFEKNPTDRNAIAKIFEGLEDVMQVTEAGTRVASFMAVVEQGKSDLEAAQAARNASVDFNRRGTLGPLLSSAFLFINANIQGKADMVRALGRNPVRGAQLAGGLIALGFLRSTLSYMVGGDDDSGVPKWDTTSAYDKLSRVGFMYNGRFYGIPSGWGLGMFMLLGDSAAAAIFGERKRQIVPDLMGQALSSISPIPSATPLQAITPTLLRPLAEIAENKNFAGAPIMPERNPFSKTDQPDSQLAFRTTPQFFKTVAEALNKISGGDKYEAGLIDISPETIQHWMQFAGGGPGKFFERSAAVATEVLSKDGENPRMGDIPLVRVFVREAPEWFGQQLYYENASKIEAAHARKEARDAYDRRFEQHYEALKDTNEKLSELRKQRNSAKTEAQEAVYQRRIDALIGSFNKRVGH